MKKKRKNKTQPKRYTTATIIEKFREYWDNRFDYSLMEYEFSDEKIKIICKDHGVFELKSWQHKKGVGCYKCGRIASGKKLRVSNRSNTNEFVIKAKKVFNDLYDYSKTVYVHSHEKLIITCQTHGDIMVRPYRHLEGIGCNLCNIQCSVKETRWLNDLGLPNDREHRGVNLKLGGKTLVDGFDPTTNTVYEFHGDFWHGNPKIYKQEDIHPMLGKPFGQLYENTMEKEKRIRDAGYTLVTMWEQDYKK